MKKNRLFEIVAQKKKEVLALKKILDNQAEHPVNQLLKGTRDFKPLKNFSRALMGEKLSVIAEIKRASPSRGLLADISDPLQLAVKYQEAGASAISVLTDMAFFKGNPADLESIAKSFQDNPIPLLRKDFIVDSIQIAESISIGADAILLIVAVLGKEIKKFLETANALGIDAVVEVHNMAELEIALSANAKIIGINNRNLETFDIDLNTAFQLAENIPAGKMKIAESGILDPRQAKAYHQAGFDAVLIGEALVKSNNPALFMEACQNEN